MKNILAIGLIGGLLYLGSRVLGAKRLSDRSIVRTLNARIARQRIRCHAKQSPPYKVKRYLKLL
jgi:hypothetical protein